MRDRLLALEQARFNAMLPPAPETARTAHADSNPGPSDGPADTATRGTAARATRTANSSTARAANPSRGGGAAQVSNGAEGATGDDASVASRGSDARAGASRSATADPSGGAPPQRTRGAFRFGQSAEDGQERAEFDVTVNAALRQQPADADGRNNAAADDAPEGGGEGATNAEGGGTAAAEEENNDGDGGVGDAGDPDPPEDIAWADVREADPQIHAYSACDDKLFEVYGDTIHRNTGDHMPGGVDAVVDAFWRRKYREVTSSNLSLVDLPSGKPTERFILLATEEFKGVRERKWNSERVICFFAVILRKEPGKQKYKEIRELITMRLDLWEQGKYATLCRACVERGRVYPISRRSVDPERRARKYNAMVLAGKVRSAVRQATDRHRGAGLLDPFDFDVKSGKPVHEALADKHPNLMVPDIDDEDVICFEGYEKVPSMVPLTACDDILVMTAKRLKGGAGPGGVDSYLLKDMLTKFERPSILFRTEMGAWIDWIANGSPPIGALRAFLNNRLLAGKKTTPGVRPIACGEIFRRYWGKVVTRVAGFQAMEECGSVQLCAALPVGCEAAVHAMRQALQAEDWEDSDEVEEEVRAANNPESTNNNAPDDSQDEGLLTQGDAGTEEGEDHDDDEERDDQMLDGNDRRLGSLADNDNIDFNNLPTTGPGAMLVDADNGFNMQSRYAMLWTVRHLWPRAARFLFNCYRHQAKCLMRRPGGDALVILSREGCSQGCPLSAFAYGVGMVPLARRIRDEMRLEDDMVHAMFADDYGNVGDAIQNARTMKCLQKWGPPFGYHPTPPKSKYVCEAREEPAVRQVFDAFDLQIEFSRGERYLGGFLGSQRAKVDWVRPQVEEWCRAVAIMEDIARRYPQTAYFGLAVSLQNEWQHVCRTVPGVELLMEPLEAALASFLSTLLDVEMDARGDLRTLLGHKVKQAGMGIPKPTVSAKTAFQTSEEASQLLISSLKLRLDVDVVQHKAQVARARNTAVADRETVEKAECNRQLENASRQEENRIKRAKESGAWLTCVPSTKMGTTLSRDEFVDNVRWRNGFAPTNLPETCDGCGERFTTEHGLNCKVGGLVHERHEIGADEWEYLGAMAYSPSACSHRPKVNEGNPRGAGNGGTGGPQLAPPFRARGTAGGNRAANGGNGGANGGNTATNGGTNAANNAANNANNNTAAAEGAAVAVVETDLEGDKGIRGFWAHGRECIFDIRITNTDSRAHRNKDPTKCLESQEKEKKDKYERACREQRKDFTALVYSIDGMAGPKTRAAERRMAARLAWKWKREYSEMVGFVRTRMSLAVVRSNTLMWRGSRTRRRAHPGTIQNGGAMDTWQTFGE